MGPCPTTSFGRAISPPTVYLSKRDIADVGPLDIGEALARDEEEPDFLSAKNLRPEGYAVRKAAYWLAKAGQPLNRGAVRKAMEVAGTLVWHKKTTNTDSPWLEIFDDDGNPLSREMDPSAFDLHWTKARDVTCR
jgi:hypothetical protein